MVKKVNAEKTKNKERGGAVFFIPACLFLGMGWGFVFDKLVAGIFFGLGIGFLLFAMINLLKKKK